MTIMMFLSLTFASSHALHSFSQLNKISKSQIGCYIKKYYIFRNEYFFRGENESSAEFFFYIRIYINRTSMLILYT